MKVIILRYSEIFLKGNNRHFFEKALVDNIKTVLKPFSCQLTKISSRYVVRGYAPEDENAIVDALKCVFGIYSLSVAQEIPSTMDDIVNSCLACAPENGTFRVNCNRADKTFPLHSMEVTREVGHVLLEANSKLSVDLHTPEHVVSVDIRENGKTFVFTDIVRAVDGMPVGTGGRALALLSGGIDSPVALYMLAKRGMVVTALHFHSYPYTSEQAKEKVFELAKVLKKFCIHLKVVCINVAEIQTSIHEKCQDSYLITILRRFMMRLAAIVAEREHCGAVVTGESLGQVASQTLESLISTNSVITMPVFRPLIGFDKDEIVLLSKKIGTFDISIKPFEDCCTVFLPQNPVTRPKLSNVERIESVLDVDTLVQNALNTIEVVNI